jgi:1-deoxy-D-xylulose-5-phosphate synthase
MELASRSGITTPIHAIGLPDRFVEHGAPAELGDICGLTAEKIRFTVADLFRKPHS